MDMGKIKKGDIINRCKCCLEEVDLKNMWTEYYSDGEREIYGEMLTECFALAWQQPSEINAEHICGTCICRLRDAVSFKKEIVYTERLLSERLKTAAAENIKQEEESDEEIKTEYLNIEYLEEDDSEKEKSDIKIEIPSIIADNEDKLVGRASKDKKYSDEDLQKCIEAVRSKALSQSKAAILYNIPRRIISAAIANTQPLEDSATSKKRRRPELQKRQENVDCIMKYSTATPFKGFIRTGYACFYCSVEYERPADLKRHTVAEHCGENMLRATVVTDQSIKLDLTDLTCKICEESIDTLEDLTDHLRLEHAKTVHADVRDNLVPFKFDGETLTCAVCSEEFLCFKLLNDHVNHSHYQNYTCDECGRGFITKRSLQSHAYRHRAAASPCRVCAKHFRTRARRLAHERAVHAAPRRHRCGYCGHMFADIARKKEHEVVAHGAVRLVYNCRACDKTYNSQKSLRTHVRSYHLLHRPYRCSQCDFGFYKNVELAKHMVKHTGEREHECGVCRKAYGRRSTLREHMRIHEDDRRFRCERCDLAFVQKCSWRAHVRAKHGEEV